MFFRKKEVLNREQQRHIEIMKKKDEKQSEYIKSAKEVIISWSKEIKVIIHEFYYISGFGESLQIYIFYKSEAELEYYIQNGIVEKMKQEFMRILGEIGYITEFNDNVRFEFDSDENVKKNYKGNYFFRLR